MIANVEIRQMTFAENDIRHRMAQLLMLYSVTFTLIFKAKRFLVMQLL